METLITPYTLPLAVAPFKREGLIVRLRDANGKEGYGEIAPLPGFSKETLEDVKKDFDRRFPSVSFGLQSARDALDDPLPSFSLPLSALLLGSAEEMVARGQAAIAEGFISAKIKVRHLTFDEAARVINTLRFHLSLRIDVNGVWNLQDSIAFFKQFPEGSFEYIEDPVSRIEDLEKFPFPFAIDGEPHRWDLPNLKAVVLKPTFLGDVRPIVKEALERGKKAILSGVFESGVGIAAIASLACRLGLDRDPIGLGTYSYLKSDTLTTPLTIRGGRLEVPDCRTCNIH